MAHFSSYNTSDSTTGATPLSANASITPIQIQTGVAAVLAGTVISDQGGTLTISQSFDGTNFDASTQVIVTGGTGASFNVDIIAPYAQLTYLNGGTGQTYMRLFARAFGNRTNG